MYCAKCKYTSFDHVSACPKCGRDWEEERKTLNLDWLVPSSWKPEKASSQTASAGASSGTEFAFSAAAHDEAAQDQQKPMQTSAFLDLADSGDTAELVYDLSSSDDQAEASDQTAETAAGEHEATTADDEIVLDFDTDELAAEPEPAAALEEPAEPDLEPAFEEARGEDASDELQLEVEAPEREQDASQAVSDDSPAAQSEEEELSDILEDEELELDDILLELDADEDRSKGR